MEHMHGATAYLVQINSDFGIRMVSVFYVSKELGEWAFDREQLLKGSPFVYAFDMRYDSNRIDAEVGPIGIRVKEGGMVRRW